MTAPPLANMGAVAPLVFIISLLCMPAGIGGGILFVPVLRLIGGLSQKESSSLSQALIAASALAANLFNFYAQYRAKNEPKALIVWPFVILMLPCAVVGSLIGIYLYSWLPSLLQLILYFIVACFGSLAAYRKGYKLWKAETDAKESAIREFDSTTTVTCSPSVEPVGIPPLQEMPGRRKFIIYVVVTVVVWAVCLVFPPLRGSSSSESVVGVPYCEVVFWVLAALQAVLLLFVPAGFICAERSPTTVRIGFILIAAMIVIGLIASMVGIGGGLLMNPLVLSLGLDPKQSTATTAIVIFATSTSTALSLALGGYFPPASDMWITVMPFIGALLGKTIVGKLVSLTGRLSVLVILLGTMVAIGGTITVISGIISLVHDAGNGENILQFGSFC